MMDEEHIPIDLISSNPFFATLIPAQQEQLAVCARRAKFQPGDLIIKEGDPSNTFFVIGHGTVVLTAHTLRRGDISIQTVQDGDVLGWSWLFPPFKWHFDARAQTLVRAIAFDATMVRELSENDHEIGYQLMRRFASVMLDRLQTARMQLLDVYRHPL